MADSVKKTQAHEGTFLEKQRKHFPKLVGILNCTPDSYFEGNRYMDREEAIEHGLRLFDEGADIVDIGGESTRPHQSTRVSEEEEMQRVVPVIEGIRKQTDRPLSIDTFKPRVAEAALKAGVTILNDITGAADPRMRKLAANTGSPIVVMHMKGTPHEEAQSEYPHGIIPEICAFFQKRISVLLNEGVKESQIILDPGIGGGSFGKTPEQSVHILKNLKTFKALGFPLFIGLSRKSFLQKILKKEASEVLSTTLALNTMAALEGVGYIRVHDVAQHREILTLLEYMEAIA